MKVLVILEAVFLQTPDGRIWTSGVYTQSFFSRYLTAFSQVVVAARVRSLAVVPAENFLIDDPRITFVPIPWYRGLLGFLRERKRVVTILRQAVHQAEAVILRVPSPLAGRVQSSFDAVTRPFAVEVVGDPWDAFAPRAIRHPLRPFLRRQLRTEMKHQCLNACACAYVTAKTLQLRYPATAGIPSFAYSSIELEDHSFALAPRQLRAIDRPIRLVSVGNMSHRYKGHDVLLQAIGYCHSQKNIKIELVLVGDGIERSNLEQLSTQLGLSHLIRFTGHLSQRSAIEAELDLADAFVLASRQEGLPRAMIEAMARGLPCLGTRVGGIPELLTDDALVPVDDHGALGHAIFTRLRDPAWMAAASTRNLAVARTYHQDLLREHRQKFYCAVHEATAHWMTSHQGSPTADEKS